MSMERDPLRREATADAEGTVVASVRARCEVVEAVTVELNRARDDLDRALRTLEATERDTADLLAHIAVLRRRPSRVMVTYALVIGSAAGFAAFLVLVGLLTLTHALAG